MAREHGRREHGRPEHKRPEMQLRLQGYRLTTAEIVYHMPDHPGLLQTFVWRQLDLPPRFPRLTEFLEFWRRHLDGPLHSVKVAAAGAALPRTRHAVHWSHLH